MGWYRRLVNVLRGDRVSTDIQREMEFHMAERADDLMTRGLSEADARREARRRFGNPVVQKERTRDADVLTWLESLVADVRYALRALRASPGFALVAILSLGLGIGANTAIFSLINALTLRTLPVSDPEELVQVTIGQGPGSSEFTNPLWEAIRDRQDVFSDAFAYGADLFNLTSGGEVRRARGNWVSGEYFSTLGVRQAVGRLLTRTDDIRGCQPVAVLGYGFWQSELGGSAGVVGKTIALDGKPHVILGVTEPSFFGVDVGQSVQVYVPLCLRPGLDARSTWFLHIIGRPKPGVTASRVSARVAAIAPSVFEATVPGDWGISEKAEYRKNTLGVRSAANGLSDVRRRYERSLTVLMGVVGVVLLIACANVANLLLARAAVRGREMAIRLAIGAARQRLVRQMLTESVLLAGVGALIGAALARWGTALLVGLLARGTDPVFLDLTMDGRVLAFTLVVAGATGLLFGLAPAWRAARVEPQASLKASSRGITEGHSRFTIGKALVIGQIALSVVLVAGAGLLLGSFRKLTTLDPGFDRDGVLIVSVNLRDAGYSSDNYGVIHDELLARFRALPGVRAAGASELTPISGSAWNGFIKVDGFVPNRERDNLVYFNRVTPGFFAAMGTPILGGRDFDERDGPSAQKVAIVNEAMARKFYRGRSPLGQRYRDVEHDSLGPPVEIVGMVKDAKYRELREEPIPTVYVAIQQDNARGPYGEYELRTAGAPSALAPAVRRMAAEMNRAIAIEITPLSVQLDSSLVRDRLLATLSGVFGALALLLAAVGLYGTLSYNVARRRNEIGIRMALGAARGRVVRLVMGEVAKMVVVGVILGGAAALGSARLVRSLLYGVSASDPMAFAGAVMMLAMVGLLAAAAPAVRAARVDPMAALRDE